MRWLAVALMLGGGACRPDCEAFTSVVTPGCATLDGGAFLAYRPYVALDDVFVDRCEGALTDAGLEFTAAKRTCAAGTSSGESFRSCSLPELPAGRYAVGENTLVVPADGGLTHCE